MSENSRKFDIAIVGAGVVGLNLAFWISELYDYSVLLIDREPGVAFHQSMRNTGGVHRPAFVDARYRGGQWMERSYKLWSALAQRYNLPWKVIGRITLAVDEKDAFLIEQAYKWAVSNGLSEDELEFVSGEEVKKFEPNVSCVAGVVTKRETITSYTEMGKQLIQLCEDNGVVFLKGSRVTSIGETADGVELQLREIATNNPFQVRSSFVINAAGGAALELARKLGLGGDYVDVHLRGEYYIVRGPVVDGITSQIYPLTRHGIEGIDLSYTGPHLVTRFDGMGGWRKELGPTAAPVLGAYAYQGVSESFGYGMSKLFRDPVIPRLKFFSKREFMSFAWNQWRMVSSAESVVAYLKKCIPSLTSSMIAGKGFTGIIVEYMNSKGFISEPVLLEGKSSISILYAGVGATGSPAYAAHLVKELGKKGVLSASRAKHSPKHSSLWAFESAAPD